MNIQYIVTLHYGMYYTTGEIFPLTFVPQILHTEALKAIMQKRRYISPQQSWRVFPSVYYRPSSLYTPPVKGGISLCM